MDRKEQIKKYIDLVPGNILSAKFDITEIEIIYLGNKKVERITSTFEIISEKIEEV